MKAITTFLIVYFVIVPSYAQNKLRQDSILSKTFKNIEIENLSIIVRIVEEDLKNSIGREINNPKFLSILIEHFLAEESLIDYKSLREIVSTYNQTLDSTKLFWEIQYLKSYSTHSGESKSWKEYYFTRNSKYLRFLKDFSKNNSSVSSYLDLINENNEFPDSNSALIEIINHEKVDLYSELDFKIRLIITIQLLSENLDNR